MEQPSPIQGSGCGSLNKPFLGCRGGGPLPYSWERTRSFQSCIHLRQAVISYNVASRGTRSLCTVSSCRTTLCRMAISTKISTNTRHRFVQCSTMTGYLNERRTQYEETQSTKKNGRMESGVYVVCHARHGGGLMGTVSRSYYH